MKLTLEHNASAALLPDDVLVLRLMSCKVIPWQGWLLLQLKIMASSEALVPLMSLYTTLLTCTADAYQSIIVNVSIQRDGALITRCREELVVVPGFDILSFDHSSSDQ
ncbi:hypothetical protein MLD38_003604 [Melastoma candidum]|uniref:Uncharacterized protein n=1 Tax=Melastoma candidum TaxID=119954 RepID=A0ACB9SBL7_9MYRT|nr:hypothetical protein MLD38_003604 [Melastoma candidum]